ncbi:type I-C CRISPR-associated protein Cas5c [Sphingomonas elodea]|uniref:type I-C CRISPR-associated protein Cas5c n=1 Tax=Sphingomonas elodea TaxID=179878 RepID=UPI00049578C7|nr:type I-C CRISPR-associated protein Cas5c [Sphingomonas elodea]
MSVRLKIWGEYACFTRPEMKVERVSYDVITPSAARGILEAIHWKPAIRWHVTRLHVLNPIRFQSIRRNEVGAKASAANAASAMKRGNTEGLGIAVDENRQQRAALVLVDVAYVIEAHFTMTARAGAEDSAAKHISMFNRRALQGQCFHRPCLGTREFPAEFALIEEGTPLPPSTLVEPDRDLGWMLHDIDFAKGNESRFFRAQMRDGVIDVPPFDAEEVVR